MTMETIIKMLIPNPNGKGFLLNYEGKNWKVYAEKGNYEVYLGRCLEWETPTFIPLETWAQAEGLIGSLSEQKKAKEDWGKAMAGWI